MAAFKRVLISCSVACVSIFPLQAESLPDFPIKPRARVIVVNDFGGDPDGLFQIAHHLLSPSVEVRGIIASKHYDKGFYKYPGTPEFSLETLQGLLEVMQWQDKVPVFLGAAKELEPLDTPQETEATRFIVAEAMRGEVNTPLYIACGAGLTDLASAYLLEPQIAERVRLVWIGGLEYRTLTAPPPKRKQPEYNTGIDLKAAQVIFNQSEMPIWQIPRDAYRQTLVSMAELEVRLDTDGPLGRYLYERMHALLQMAHGKLGEAYAMGDNPLVLLTALQSSWSPDPSSSEYFQRPAPLLDEEGRYLKRRDSREIRVYLKLDTRLMFEDMFAKIKHFDAEAYGRP
ncbi:nucleoside hydrolase [Pelagicoccus enzymogenes]|nr:nucleoside hydrolase [Pelagicoccus enzymogenes]